MREFPAGTVTFLFTDVEGSTRLLQELGDGYGAVLAEHRRVLREAFAGHGGVEVDTQGDAFFVAFGKASDAVAAAEKGRDALTGPIRVRMGLHTGEPVVTEEGYVGLDVHRAARIAAAGHGGQILASQSTRDLVGGDSLRNLGEHRLKDLTAPERIYQLGDGEFPPLKSLNQSNLPVQPTPLVGRASELEEVLELLRFNRILTLTGAGGSGKTRLALQVAAELIDEFGDGVWFVSLAALTDPELVLPTIGSTLGAKDDIVDFLKCKRLLLVLDNVEQLLPIAASEIAGLLNAPNIKVLATSRERLALSAEQEYAVSPLSLDDAVKLFTLRARQLKPLFEPDEHVTEIARHLDGLPLAVELAAARIKILTPAQITSRLGQSLELLKGGARDLPERQQTLRGTIEWSYRLLGEEERSLFVDLGVLSGSFDLEAAESVANAQIDVLASLVDKSLLRQTDGGRFFMLETIREFVLERLADSADAINVRRRHAGHFLALAKQSKPRMWTPEIVTVVQQLARDEDNFRAALAWMIVDRDIESALSLGAELSPFWLMRNYTADARRWRVEVLSRRQLAAAPTRAAAARAGGLLALLIDSDYDSAETLLKESLAVYHELGLTQEVAFVVTSLGGVLHGRGDLQKALEYRKQGLALHRQLGNTRGEINALHLLGETYRDLGQLDQGETALEEAVQLARDLGNLHAVASSLHSLGDLALDRGDLERARERYLESLDFCVDVDDRRSIGYCLAGLASVLAAKDPSTARPRCGERSSCSRRSLTHAWWRWSARAMRAD